MSNISIKVDGSAAYVSSPYNAEFVRRIKTMGGRWDADRRAWKVSPDEIDAVRAMMREVYGESDEDPAGERVTLLVAVIEAVDQLHGPITLAGKTIAKAWGRDSGARVGDDVAFTNGAPQSGGSVKNWRTCIPAGASFEIYNVPMAKAQEAMANPPEWASIQIKGAAKIDREALEAEKAKLLARLAEIEELLK